MLQCESFRGSRARYTHDANDIDANQRSPGSVTANVNATMSHKNLRVGNGLDFGESESGDSCLVMASCSPLMRAEVLCLVVPTRYNKCRGKIIANDECAR